MYKIAIIGLGPRGLSVFDRIIAYARNDASATPIELYLFDSKEFGPGCHTTDQADHLLVNTVACQMTQFSDDTVRGAGPLLYGPSFSDWLISKNSKPPAASTPRSRSTATAIIRAPCSATTCAGASNT